MKKASSFGIEQSYASGQCEDNNNHWDIMNQQLTNDLVVLIMQVHGNIFNYRYHY